MTLFELSQDYKEFLMALEIGAIPEEAIKDTLDSITSLIDDKADNIACIIKTLQAEAKMLKEQEDSFAERRKEKQKRAESLTKYLANMLLEIDRTKIETVRNKIYFTKSECVKIEDEEAFIHWALKERDDLLKFEAPKPSLTEIKKAIKSGDKFEGVSIEKRQNIQIK